MTVTAFTNFRVLKPSGDSGIPVMCFIHKKVIKACDEKMVGHQGRL